MSGNRQKVTLTWRPCEGQMPERLPDLFVRVPNAMRTAAPGHKRVLRPFDTSDYSFQKRMDNWRRTVTGAGGAGSCCASWAEMYIRSRANDGNGDEAAPPRMIVTTDQLDGWLVEGAVRTMQIADEQSALRLWYVRRYPEHWIKTCLMLRGTAVRFILESAQKNLQSILTNIKLPINMQMLSNNLHAGKDPRPESDAPMASLALGKTKGPDQ